jgi:hypothetical protein
MILAADDYPLADVLWTFVIFFGLMIAFGLILLVFGDLFRRDDVSGWAKAGWIGIVFVLPLIGSLTYLILQGPATSGRTARQVDGPRPQGTDDVPSEAAPGFRGADQIARGKELLDTGAISQEEFEQLKRRVLV